ncbi:hypothetical protein [Nostoc sp. 106C]|uniref:hypothetical protein n=1 Tax=Nostoc sp. 106C TaxID=1932667 RepID=UPI001181707C|nr:hypothetical protein [Nostoc sp. 106C]
MPPLALSRKLVQRSGSSSRVTLSAIAHRGNPQDRIASLRNCPVQRTGSPMTNDSCKQIY